MQSTQVNRGLGTDRQFSSSDEENKEGQRRIKKECLRTSPVVQRLRLHTPSAGGSPQGTKSHMPQLKDPACFTKT